MNINVKIADDEAEHPELGKVPVVSMDVSSEEEVPNQEEPTPAMWTAACIYSLHVSGKLMELTKQFIETQKSGDEAVGG